MMEHLPRCLKSKIVELYKDNGKEWLKSLPYIIKDCTENWAVRIMPPSCCDHMIMAVLSVFSMAVTEFISGDVMLNREAVKQIIERLNFTGEKFDFFSPDMVKRAMDGLAGMVMRRLTGVESEEGRILYGKYEKIFDHCLGRYEKLFLYRPVSIVTQVKLQAAAILAGLLVI